MNVGRASKSFSVLIMAGGTGGHVYPALAVADSLRSDGNDVVWLGVRHGLEARLVPRAGIELRFVNIAGVRGKGTLGWLLAPFKLALAVLQALIVVWRVRPAVVLGMGGYASGPGGIAAWLLRRPLLIHEQNAVPGLTNRLLARFATVVMEAFPGSFPAKFGAVHTGNPVRMDIAALPQSDEDHREANDALHLLVLGGSQGAKGINDVVPRTLEKLRVSSPIEVWHQTGERHLSGTRELYSQLSLDTEPCAYIDDMCAAYGWADLAVCRSGAMTVAELAAAGVPAVLVPFPHAVDDHQTANANYLVDAGAAVVVAESSLEPNRLAELVHELAQTGQRLAKMARAARACALPDAAVHVARLCREVAHA